MARCFKFSLLAVHVPAPRDERLNVGIIVFRDSQLDVRLLRSLRKVSALSLAFNEDIVRASAQNLVTLDKHLSDPGDPPESRLEQLKAVSPFYLAPLAYFFAPTAATYEEEISTILRTFVEPEPALRSAGKGKATALAAALRKSFRNDRILAAKGEDLNAHRVVTNVELATGLIADFVLKNGAMHIFETVDASSENSSVLAIAKNVGLAAITIEQARICYGNSITVARLVYQTNAQTEALVAPALHAAEHQGVELVNWASTDDQIKLRTTVSSLATPLPRKQRGGLPINASTQPRFAIN